ncbi:MAG TPA: thioester reductase domain-containing protein, partial [Thermoanaerobaculia bacterium]|nr:thioester reductase domain-containing protein [Thermoanaerobaculia bacterium]
RAEDEAAGAARLEEALRTYRLWDPELSGRIVPVPGDLVRPLMGLPEESFRRLAGEVEAVYHAGAWVNFTYPYTTLAPGNVGGTVEALRLAATGEPKPFHFVSSIAVFAPGSVADDGLAYEDSDLPATEGLFSGYAETKWVAERLVREAGERGLPVTIHRPGVIGGGARTGAGNPRDLAWNLLKGCIELGAAPRGIGTADVAPADSVAAALVEVTRQRGSAGRAFHYPNPRPTPWDRLFDGAEAAGFPLRRVEYPEWREGLLAAVGAGRENALAAFRPLLPDVDRGEGAVDEEAEALAAERVALSGRRGDDDANTRAALEGTGITCPRLDEELLRRYLGYFVETGFLKAPAGVGA